MTVNAKNHTPVRTTTTVIFAIDDTEIKSVEREIPANDDSEITFTHTFEESGTYTPKINGQKIGDETVEVTESKSASNTQSEDAVPGFGIVGSIAGTAGLAYLIKNQNKE